MFALGLLGTIVSAVGTIAAGQAQANAATAQAQALEFKAKQEEQAATEARAASQRSAIEQRREGRYAMSQLIARAAASGGNATDPTVLQLGESITGRSEYGALMETYKGENRARGLEDQAAVDRLGAQAHLESAKGYKTSSMFSAAGSILGGMGSAFSVFNKSGGQAVAPGVASYNPYYTQQYGGYG